MISLDDHLYRYQNIKSYLKLQKSVCSKRLFDKVLLYLGLCDNKLGL